ncbi:MAG: sulfite exporter TauE/SafE family protein [Gemmatimonadaceae bacterium]
MSIRLALLVLIGATSALFIVLWVRSLARGAASDTSASVRPTWTEIAIGAVSNFFDTLGIGSFATTTAAYKALRLVPDEHIPGTLLIGHALPVATQAFIFIAGVHVDTTVLLTLIAACVAGGWLGAGVATRLPRRPIQIGMGSGLLLAATLMVLTQVGALPGGGTAQSLAGGPLVFAAVMSALFGALLMIGIGNYAPTLILLSLLGMDPRAAFPIMMGAAALVNMAGGLRFISRARYHPRAALGLTLGGIPAVLLAGLVVKTLPLEVLRWVVVAVVTYAAVMMLRSAFVTQPSPAEGVAEASVA